MWVRSRRMSSGGTKLPGSEPRSVIFASQAESSLSDFGRPGSFVPPEEIRRLRTHTRYRRHLVQARTAEKARCEKLLEDAHLKLSSVITTSTGWPGGRC